MENPERMHMSSPTEGASSLAAGEAQDGGSLSGDEEEEEEDAAPLQPMICLIQEQAKSMVAIQELQRDVDILLEFREQLLSSLGGLYTSGTGTGTPRGLSSPGPGSVSGRISRHHSQPTIGAASAPRRGFSLSPASRVMGVKTPSSHTSAFRRHYTASKDLPSKSRSAENDSETVDTSDEMDGRHPWSRRGVGSGGLVQSGHATAPRYHHTARARTRRRFSANVVPGSPAASGDVFPGSKGNSEPNAPLVQDSGFSTETKDNSSSGEAHNNARPTSLATATVTTASSDRTQLSSSSSERNLVYSDWMPDIRWPDGKKSQFDADPEDELWNLLDVIHRKGVRLRKEAVEATTPVDKCEPQAPPVSVENIIAELEALRVERDRLQGEVLDLKRENVSSKSQVNSLQDQVLKVHDEKRRLEDQLKTAVSWKTELDNKIHDMHLQFVKSPSHSSKSTASSATNADVRLKKNALTRVQYVQQNLEEKTDGKLDVEDSPVVADGDDAAAVKKLRSRSEDNLPRNPARLPSLPVSLPAGKINVSPNRAKISAVLQEKDILVLKKQLLLYIQAYEVTKARLGGVQREWASRVNEWESISQEWQDELTSLRDQNQDLRFQVEEKNIELEGTKARLRMMERSIRSASSSPSPTNATPSPVTTLTRQSLKRTEKSTNLTQKFPVSENHVIIEEDEGSGVREVKKIERKGSVRFHLGEDDQSRQPRIVDPTTVTVTVGSTDIGHKDDRESSSTESSSGKVPNNFLDGKPAAENAVPPPVNFSSVIPYRPGYSAKQELVQSQSHNFFFARDPPVFNPSLRTYSANNINNNNNNNKATSPPNVVRKSSLSTNVAPSNLENANRWKSSKNSELLAKVISAATPAEFHSHVVDSHHHISAGDHIISNPQKARQRTSFWRSWWKFS